MIVATNVSKEFGRLKVLRDVNATLRNGQSIALIGPNGSGKTTFIKCLLGMVVPDKGFISFNGRNVGKDWRYREGVGYMPQAAKYPENLTIRQLFSMVKDIRGRRADSLDTELVEQFALEGMMGKRMRTLSGGTRQKVSAALAFLFNPGVLILDEPTAGLDPMASETLKEKIIREKQAGKLVIITSHVLSDLDEIISEVLYMQDGRIAFHKPWEALSRETGEGRLSKAIANIMGKMGSA